MKFASYVLAALTAFSVNASLSTVEEVEERISIFEPRIVFNEACRDGHLDTIRIMKQLGHLKKLDLYDGFLNVCDQSGSVEMAKYFLKELQVDPVRQDCPGPLNSAAAKGHLDLVKYLLTYPAILEDKNGEDALMSAVRWGHSDIVHVILDALCEVKTLKRSDMNIWFQDAFKYGHHKMAKIFLDCPQFKFTDSLVNSLSYGGKFDELKMVLSYYREMLERDGTTRDFVVGLNEHLELFKLLLCTPIVINYQKDFPASFRDRFHLVEMIRSNLRSYTDLSVRGIPQFLETFQVTSDEDLGVLDWALLVSCLMRNREDLSLMLASVNKIFPFTPANGYCDIVLAYKKSCLWIAHMTKCGDLPLELATYISSLLVMPLIEKYKI